MEALSLLIVFFIGWCTASVSFAGARLRRIAKKVAAAINTMPTIEPTAIPAFAPPLNPLLGLWDVAAVGEAAAVSWIVAGDVAVVDVVGDTNVEELTLKQTIFSVKADSSTKVSGIRQYLMPNMNSNTYNICTRVKWFILVAVVGPVFKLDGGIRASSCIACLVRNRIALMPWVEFRDIALNSVEVILGRWI
jgi:hypothetical protein